MSGEPCHRIADIRAWRGHTAGLYGLPHYPSDPPMVTNNKGWWRDVDALLTALDAEASSPITVQRADNEDGYPIWYAVDGVHAGRIHDNPTCICGGEIVQLYRIIDTAAPVSDPEADTA